MADAPDADRPPAPPLDPERYASVAGLDVECDAGVVRVTLDRPDKRNALDDTMVAGLISVLEAATTDEAARCIHLRAAGEHFCAGADIVARNAPGGGRPRVGSIQRRVRFQAHRLVPLLLDVQVPIVAEVHGYAAGIGFHLALAADVCVAATDATFWEPFAARGFTPDSGGTWLLPRLVGQARAKELLLLGERLSGQRAAELGLISRALPSDDVGPEAAALVDRLASGPTVTLGLTKWLVHAGASTDLDRHLQNEAFALELSSRSADFREGLAAFRDKRDPDFRGT